MKTGHGKPAMALAFVASVLLAANPAAGAETYDIAPVAVWTATPTYPAGQQALDRLIDGDWATACCLLDDSSNGKAGAPITGSFVLDLGKVREVSGIRFVAHKSWVNCMASNVSVYACDDPEGKVNVRCLQDKVHLPTVNTFNAAFVTWEPVALRYLRVSINDSYAGRPAPGVGGILVDVVKKLQKTMGGGPLYDLSGTGDRRATKIAEVSCFHGQPADLTLPNTPHVAYPESRLQRDWMYQDCGVENVSMVANSVGNDRADAIGPDISQCFTSKTHSTVERAMLQKVLDELRHAGVDTSGLKQRVECLAAVAGNDPRWREVYLDACRQRRQERLKVVRQWATQFIYTKHFVLGGSQFEPTEDMSDEQWREWIPARYEGSQLCLATIGEDGTVANEVLIDKPRGVIRDPNLSFDGKTLVFAMRDDFTTDDYHLYAMDMADRRIRQITFSPTIDGKIVPCCDMEPCFAANGNIVFQSSRCGQSVDCWPRPTSNLYTCDIDGQYIRRLAFDQVQTLYPQSLADGRVLYTRWEYNDRNAFSLQSLFAMNADGTAQMAYYGNNSDWPMSLVHARGIPGTDKVIAVIMGHHSSQKGKLVVVDHSKGFEENAGIDYVAGASPDGRPGRQPSKAPEFDYYPYTAFGQIGPQWQYPFAFDEDHYLVAFSPEGYYFYKGPHHPPMAVYYMTADGNRELLAFDWTNSCGQAIPLMTTQRPPVKPSSVDWRDPWGTFYVQDVHEGPGLKGVGKGTAKRLRVVGLEYRAAAIDKNYLNGHVGGSQIQTPIAVGNGAMDVKHVLGEVDLEEDGSVYFEVPARTAVYFQLLDAKGRCVQTMRSWTMVQPGERMGCVGCHESKLQAGVMAAGMSMALRKPAQELQPLAGQPPHPLLARLRDGGHLKSIDGFLGLNKACSLDADAPTEGFSYEQLVQPIWDNHCIACHRGEGADSDKTKRSSFLLTGAVDKSPATPQTQGGRAFTQSYLALTAKGQCTPLLNWVHARSFAPMLSPYACGSARSKLMEYLEPSHYEVQVTDAEKRVIACWIDLAVPFCGSYGQANTWSKEQKELYEYYQNKRVVLGEQEMKNIKEFID
ncbi:MAG: hypothetical protein RBS80_29995 [Thermoguttaceae bacterium]|nr:hypothetical protein [Thermoguttaceae bacterium]